MDTFDLFRKENKKLKNIIINLQKENQTLKKTQLSKSDARATLHLRQGIVDLVTERDNIAEEHKSAIKNLTDENSQLQSKVAELERRIRTDDRNETISALQQEIVRLSLEKDRMVEEVEEKMTKLNNDNSVLRKKYRSEKNNSSAFDLARGELEDKLSNIRKILINPRPVPDSADQLLKRVEDLSEDPVNITKWKSKTCLKLYVKTLEQLNDITSILNDDYDYENMNEDEEWLPND